MVLKLKLNGRKKSTAIIAWAVSAFRYQAGILKCEKTELKDVNMKSRKTITMYGALLPKSDVKGLCIKTKEVARGLMSVEHCVKEEEISLVFHVNNFEENLIKGVASAETINTKDPVMIGEFKKQEQNWHEKKMHGLFVREIPQKVDQERTWQLLSKADLKIGTETLLCAAH